MASRTSNGGFATQLGKLDLITASMMMVFAVLGLVMTGLLGDIVELLERETWLPFTVSLATLVGIFLTSETRDPSRYSDPEKALIFITVVVMALHSFTDVLADLMVDFDPWLSLGILVLMMVTSGVLAR